MQVAADYQRTGVQPGRLTVQNLIEMLLSADPAERLVAGDTLKLVTGTDLGYDASAPLVERQAAIQRWKAWLEETPDPGDSGDDR